jgi:serine/threonine-protein kinase
MTHMAAEHPHPTDREQLLDEVVAAYLDAVETQGPQDPQPWLARYPELAQELAEFFTDEDRFGSLMAPLREAASSSATGPFSPHGLATPRDGTRVQGPPPDTLGEYEILEEIARGGMGVVFKARQRRLQRQVALKMILAGDLAAPTAVQRFRFEAETVASLDHPNIVPIYDVGEDNNRHFFTMKLIDGSSLTRHVQRLKDDPDAAADLVATVARAVDYAHRRGLLHRDLKPANILIDGHGRPHVTDFGLAKWVNNAVSLNTESGIAVGTPSYMAPEQAGGPHKALTTAADVYSLGAILYELLSGRPPFKEETALLTLRAVLDTEPPAPRTLNPRAPVDLEIICLKCLQKEPGRRYASAAALADDLERYLHGEPIQARPVLPPERFWRWCRRKPIVAGLVAALVLSLAVGGGLAAWQWQVAEANYHRADQNWHDAEAASRIAERQTLAAKQANQEAELHLREKEKANGEAEKSFKQAHELVTELIVKLGHQRLRDVPGLQPLRQELLEAALGYFEEFLKQRGDDQELREQQASTYFSVGEITNLLGPRERALAAYQKSQELYRELLRTNPDNRNWQLRLSGAYLNGGVVQQSLNQPRAALATYELACALLTPLCADPEHGAKAQENLAMVFTNKGGILRTLGHLDESTAAFEETHRLLRELLARSPNATHLQGDLAVCHVNLGVLHAARGDHDQALACYEKARKIQAPIAKVQNVSSRINYDLALNQRRIGDRLVNLGRVEEGVQTLQAAEKHWRKLSQESPKVPGYRCHLASCVRSLGHAERHQGKHDEAGKLYVAACNLGEPLVRAHGTVAEYQDELAQSCYYLALTYRDLKKQPEALKAFARAVALREQMLKVNPDNLDTRNSHAITLREMALSLAAVKRTDDALQALEQAVRHERVAVERSPLVAGRISHLHTHYNHWAKVLRQADRDEESVRRVMEGNAFLTHIAAAHPDNVYLRRELAWSWQYVGDAFQAVKDRANGVKSMERATEIRRELVERHPDDWELRNDLALSYHRLGSKYYGNTFPEEALRCYDLARQHQERVLEGRLDDIEMRDNMAMVLNNLGITLANHGQPAAGVAHIRRAIVYQELNLIEKNTPRFRNTMNVHHTALTEALRLNGQLTEAVAAARQRLRYLPDTPTERFKVAVEAALVIPLVGAGKKELSTEELAQQRDFADKAMEMLRAAVARGYRDGNQLRTHSALAPLRARPDFQSLVKSLGK